MTLEMFSAGCVLFIGIFMAGGIFGYMRAALEHKREWDKHFKNNWVVPREKKMFVIPNDEKLINHEDITQSN